MDHRHRLLQARMNLLEVSHRDIEVIEKRRLKIIGESEGNIDQDIEDFKNFLFETLVTFNE